MIKIGVKTLCFHPTLKLSPSSKLHLFQIASGIARPKSGRISFSNSMDLSSTEMKNATVRITGVSIHPEVRLYSG